MHTGSVCIFLINSNKKITITIIIKKKRTFFNILTLDIHECYSHGKSRDYQIRKF